MTETDPWRCADCGVHYPIQPMARDCEARHEAEEQGQEAS